jgi:hypothetical protein
MDFFCLTVTKDYGKVFSSSKLPRYEDEDRDSGTRQSSPTCSGPITGIRWSYRMRKKIPQIVPRRPK